MKKGPFKMKGFSGFGNSPVKSNGEGKAASDRLKNVKISKESYDANVKRQKDQGKPDLAFDDFLREKGFKENQINLINEGKMRNFKQDKQAISDTINAYKFQNLPKIK